MHPARSASDLPIPAFLLLSIHSALCPALSIPSAHSNILEMSPQNLYAWSFVPFKLCVNSIEVAQGVEMVKTEKVLY